jgi:hypothetical protein
MPKPTPAFPPPLGEGDREAVEGTSGAEGNLTRPIG